LNEASPLATVHGQPTWQVVRAEILRRIRARYWEPGALIPGEMVLAKKFGCARATVNRALRDLAEEGLVERRRKAGTRVALHPVRKATLEIPVTRIEVEKRGASYRHAVIERETAKPPELVASKLGSGVKKLLHLRSLHFADDHPFIYEDRWVNQVAVPDVMKESFEHVSTNEWLVRNAPFTHGDITFGAENTTEAEAQLLEAHEGDAILVIQRITWSEKMPITFVRLAHAPGHRLRTTI
jgi:GntR family histidine utilization transcriptional repressor